ncbi:MAG: hypothetical protein K6A64_07210 [Bacteroidales bacterium]|nr:hypothetical protein [Bacteroidales bacterium]
MKRHITILVLLCALLPGASSCIKEQFDDGYRTPEGAPVSLFLGFGTDESAEIQVGTKAGASRVDESRVHDLYVLIFRPDDGGDGGRRLYGRYFSYEHLIPTLPTLDSQKNEGWWVDNVTINDINSTNNALKNKQTRGVVKIATESCNNATLVLLANISNTITSLDGKDARTRLSEIQTLEELENVKVILEQNVVNRNNLFLMLGMRTLNTGDLKWGTLKNNTPQYNEAMTGDTPQNPPANSQIQLTRLDAKVKFRVRYNPENITAVTPRYWQACKVPQWTYLLPRELAQGERDIRAQEEYFKAEQAYFEEKETDTDDGTTWDVFTFYMLENRQTPRQSVAGYTGTGYTSKYYLRELQEKAADPEHGSPYVVNGKWMYAREEATYVQFDLVLTLSELGIQRLGEHGKSAALTSEALFTVHLGDFTSSSEDEGGNFDDYNTLRGHSYIYNIIVNNSNSIYVEVKGTGGEKLELEPGHEGSLLLTTSGIINCDSHYEYHSLDFGYDAELGADAGDEWPRRKKVSWYVKTPFYEGGGKFNEATGLYGFEGEPGVYPDFQWILFSLNDFKDKKYLTRRKAYPGLNDTDKREDYKPNWSPSLDGSDTRDNMPKLIDINQLINFIFVQNKLRHDRGSHLFGSDDHIRFTAFVNEYYYETDPRTYEKDPVTHVPDPLSGELNPNLWREFVNAAPRELHILANTQISDDRQSDLIEASHSIIQQSIQTIYNIYAPDLTSLWGTEHTDEMSWRHRSNKNLIELEGWPWWKAGKSTPAGVILHDDDENGRLNTAGLWGLESGMDQRWNTYLNFESENNTPELRDDGDHNVQLYSCLTRNRDNNGNGVIDPEELRWYTASINQLVGMWVGNESLSLEARLYQPVDGTKTTVTTQTLWRSQVISSTSPGNKIDNPRILVAEEGATKTTYDDQWWKGTGGATAEDKDKIMSVRCVRNIGTFSDKGTPKEISEAPFDTMVDQYFDFEAGQDPDNKAWPNDDGTYTIRFTRLNSKSIREYTEEDLPYHEEYSMNNRVYLRFTAQNPADRGTIDIATSKPSQEKMHNDIAVHNDYCPPGYRVPNMTELLMMVAVLPSSYWDTNTNLYPCRTYFSRGKLGSLKTDGETRKIGWAYNASSKRIFLQNSGQEVNNIRCIRDDNMVGDITGKLTVTHSDRLHKGDNMDLNLYFTSSGSAIQNVNLMVCYTDADDNKREIELSSAGLELNGTTVRQTVSRRLPVSIGVSGFMTVRAVVRNAAGIERTFDAPIGVISDLYTSLKLLPCEYDANEQGASDQVRFPILITAAHFEKPITKWVLKVTDPDKRITRTTLDIAQEQGQDPTYLSKIITYQPGTLKTGTYSFQLEAVCDGITTRSEEVAMDILKADYDPLKGVDLTSVDDETDLYPYPWKRMMVGGLDFAAGDFIEADMDISRCEFKPFYSENTYTIDLSKYTYYRKISETEYEKLTQEYYTAHPDEQYYVLNETRSLGLDNLITFGVSDIGWTDWSLHVFYPAEPLLDTANGSFIRFNTVWNAKDDVGYAGINQSNVIMTNQPLHIRLDREGLYWNNIEMDVSMFPEASQPKVREVLDRLTAAKTLYVGSVGGGKPPHISRAKYRYVRVVYNGEFSTTRNGHTDFKTDPVYGGEL